METSLDTSSLPPGFGFHPTDVELISHYLKRKIMGYKTELDVIPVVDIYKHEPWDLPAKTKVSSRDCKWHFFNTRDRKYPTGSRTNRATEAGYWKSTGKDRVIRSRNRVIGTKKTLVFHEGRPPRGKRTDWIMHEYFLDENECKATAAGVKELFVLCRVTKRDGMGNGDEEEHAQMEDATSSRPKNFPISPQDTADLNEHGVVENPGPEDPNMEAWVAELFDPNFCVVPAATGCKIEVEETDPGYFAPPTYQPLPLNVGPNSCRVENYEQSFLRELNYWSDLQEMGTDANWGHVDDDVANYYTPRSNFAGDNEIGSAECMNNDKSTSETGIIIRRREDVRGSDSIAAAPGSRIKLQVHKMETKSPVATNHTVMLESNHHHMEVTEQPPEAAVISNGQGGVGVKRECVLEHPPAAEEVRGHGRTCTSNPPGGCRSSRRFRSGIKGMVQRAFNEAHVLTRRCSPIGVNCLFLGTCRTGYVLDDA